MAAIDKSQAFPPLYQRLRAIMHEQAAGMDVTKDEPGEYLLQVLPENPKDKPLWFGSIKIGKAYVSYHLVPLYDQPELLNDVSDALKKRMQGKTCFNFTREDDALLEELAALTEKSRTAFRERNGV